MKSGVRNNTRGSAEGVVLTAVAAMAVVALLVLVSGAVDFGDKDESFELTTTETSLGVGQEKYIVSGMTYTYVLEGMEWTSSDESVVSVTADPDWNGAAFIKGVSTGDATVSASYNGRTSTTEVHVVAEAVGNELRVYNTYSQGNDYALLSGDGFESGVLSLAFNYGGRATVTMSGYTTGMLAKSPLCTGNAALDFSSVRMILQDTTSSMVVSSGSHLRADSSDDDDIALSADSLTAGHSYAVTFKCVLDAFLSYEIKGTFDYVDNEGPVDGTNLFKKPYAWRYDGHTFSFETEFPYGLYYRYHYQNGDYVVKSGSYYRNSSVADYVETFFCRSNQVTDDISDKLKAEYQRVYGSDASLTGQDYAEFILAFVQVNWYYALDSSQYIYGKADYIDYWAFPMETIYSGCGDCEDTAIICAVLFEEAGYSAGVYDIPGHAMAAVHVADYTQPDFQSGWERMAYTVTGGDGKVFYGCETTTEYHVGIGAGSKSLINDSSGNRYEDIELYLL